MFVKVWVIELPHEDPQDVKPVTVPPDVLDAVQVYDDATPFDVLSAIDVVALLQIVDDAGVATPTGSGLTVIVAVNVAPTQLPEVEVGVMV